MQLITFSAKRLGQRVLLAAAVFVSALLAGWFANNQAFFATLGILVVPLLFVVAIYYLHPHWALLTFIIFLPVHSFIITLLIAQLRVPIALGKVIAAWKETLLVGTFLAVVLRTVLRSRVLRLGWVDAVAFGWLVLVLLHVVYSMVFRPELPLVVLAYGARDWLLYLLPYFIGRLVLLNPSFAERILTAIVAIGVVTSLFGILEYLFIPTSWWVSFGVPYYFRAFLNLTYPDYLGGLPPNYWAEVAGRAVRRAVSTHLSGQGFAMPFLIIIPTVVCRLLSRSTWPNAVWLLLCGIGLLLSITRMTIIVCALQAALLLWLFPRRSWLVLAAFVVGCLSLGVLVVNTQLREFVVDTITLSDTSGSARPGQWARGIADLIARPLGSGLGFSGQVGARFGQGGIGSEAGYFKITGDLGLPGLFLFLGWFGGILLAAFSLIRRAQGVWRQLGLITFAVAIGFLLNNLTAPPDQSPFTIYVFAWLAGLTVCVAMLPVPEAAAPNNAPLLPVSLLGKPGDKGKQATV